MMTIMKKEFSITILFMVCFMVKYVTPSVPCSSEKACRCSVLSIGEYLADCSNLFLTTVPVFYSNVVAVNLRVNSIQEFPVLEEFPKGLISLDFSNNKLYTFQNGSFTNLTSLKYLNLASNKLCLDDKTFYRGVFQGLDNLKVLNLKNNIIPKSQNNSYPSEAFSTLSSLQELSVDGLDVEGFGSDFSDLTALVRLDLSGVTTRKCHITYVSPKYFKFLPNLESLDISGCNILRIESGSLQIKNLTDLDISLNEDLTFRVLSNVTSDLQSTSIKSLRANKIHRTFGQGTEIFVEDIKFLKNTSLEELYIDSNRLELIQAGVFQHLPKSFIVASLADNKFTMGQYIFEVFEVSNVKIVNASYQHISHNPSGLYPPPRKESCDQQFRQMCPGDEEFSSTNSFSHDENVKNLQAIFEKGPSGYSGPIIAPFPPNLESFYFTKCSLRYSVPAINFLTNVIRYADLSGNILHEWIGPVKFLDHLEYIDLSNNYCTNVSTEFFCCVEKLETLLIGNNYLGFVLNSDTEGTTFSRLKNLKTLDISLNRIQVLQSNIFRGLYSLQHLDISNNALRSWTFKVRHMKNLHYVDFSNNELTDVDGSTREDLDKMTEKRNITVNFKNNNFLCNCDTLNFLKWLTKTKVNFENFESYTCTHSDASTRRFEDLDIIVSDLSFNCKFKWTIIIASSVFASVVIVIIISILVHRFRWRILGKYYSFKIKRNRRQGNNMYQRIPENGQVDEFRYDVYFIYDDEDKEFVWNATRELEVRKKRICFRERDFLIGTSDYRSICNAIKFSRKICIVLSQDLLKSNICTFQREIALAESQCRTIGRGLFLVLDHDRVNMDSLPLDILSLIGQDLYLKCPEDYEDMGVFWHRLGEILSI